MKTPREQAEELLEGCKTHPRALTVEGEKCIRALCEENKELAQDAAYQTDMACQCDIVMGQVLRQRDELKESLNAAALYTLDLEVKLEAAEALIKEADEYLDINKLTSIGHGSILHRKFKEARDE